MFIKSLIVDNFGVSIIKKDSKKVSLSLAKKDNVIGKIILISADEEFKFNNPLITDKSITVFEFIVEMNNFVKRKINQI